MPPELVPVSAPTVTLMSHTPDPLRAIAAAYRTCYSPLGARAVELGEIKDVEEYVARRMKTEHRTPLEHALFTFGIEDVSRAFSHQFVRHRHVSIAQQSQRYVDPSTTGEFRYVVPAAFEDNGSTPTGNFWIFEESIRTAVQTYMALREAGVAKEDARAVLPECTATSLRVTMNYSALLQMADIRLCTLAQREFRQVMSAIRVEVKRVAPALGGWLGPKCMEYRQGFCDEDVDAYDGCALSVVRPHKLSMGAKGDYLRSNQRRPPER